MTRRSVNLVQFWLTIIYFSIPGLAFSSAGWLRFRSARFSEAEGVDPYSYAGWIVVTTVIWALVLEHQKVNRIETLVTLQTGLRTIFRATAFSMVIALALTFFYRGAPISRVFVTAGFVLMFALSVAVLHLARTSVFGQRFRLLGPLRLAIIGADEQAVRLMRHLQGRSPIHCKIVCFVALPEQTPAVSNLPVLPWDRLEDVVDMHQCQEVLVALPASRFGELPSIMNRVQHLCVPARLVLDLGDGVFIPERVFEFWGIPLLDVSPYPVDTVRYQIGKRIFDFAFSVLALLLFAPLMFVIALAIKLTSSGPAFFAQERISLNGHRFSMLKFRTMVTQSKEASSSQHTARNDLRITAVGGFLRRTSLDELPQFFNVLRGDMSVVGPRPELTFFVQKFREEIPAYMARHNVKCGITGWAQINGLRGSDTSIPERIRYDLYYMKNWSFAFDLKIILLTIFNSFVTRGAY